MALRVPILVVLTTWLTSVVLVSALPTRDTPPPASASAAVAHLSAGPGVGDECLLCHEETVDASRYAESVHGALGLTCTGCHTDLEGQEYPHEVTPAKVDCASCHDASVQAYGIGVHAAARAHDAGSTAATCADCHTTHAIKASTDPTSPTYPLNLPATCSTCHEDGAGAMFRDSIHGHALSRSGLLVAANCSSCHGAHDILPPTDAASRVARANIPATCGTCHEGIQLQFARGSHGAALEAGSTAGPVCTDCHSAHQIQDVTAGSWRLDTIAECGTCHIDKIRTYRDTFHGQVTALGFERIAKCSDCHGAHEVHPTSDPRSMVSPERVLSTCRTCHAGATVGFTQYDPHADRNDRERNPELYYASRFMHWLLIGVFGFFGVHALLWLPRSAIERRRRSRGESHE